MWKTNFGNNIWTNIGRVANFGGKSKEQKKVLNEEREILKVPQDQVLNFIAKNILPICQILIYI